MFSDQEAQPKCQVIKGKDQINVYPAMHGYDFIKGNPMDSLDDPGVRARIFYHDCKFGYFDFIADVFENLQCDSDFSMKTISTMEDYEGERTSSNQFSIKARISAEGEGFGVNAKASFGYARSTNSDEQAAESVISKRKGEIIRAKATCLTHTIILASYIRPVFTPDFIRGLKTLHEKVDASESEQELVVADFIREFGTHYSSTTHLGAQLIYERRFESKSDSRSDAMSRSSCVKTEADASVSGGYSGLGGSIQASAEVEAKQANCNSVKQKSAFSADEGLESTKTISRGSRPKDLKSWVDAAFTPVPIIRTLDKISDLFKDEWLTSNQNYGFDVSLSGGKMKEMFNKAAKKYCQIMLPGQLDENCEFIVCKNSGLQCLNGGDCVNRGGRAVCSCPSQFSGETCENTRVDGGWGSWTGVSQCSASCGGGKKVRTRRCDNPVPRNGGRECQGRNSDAQDCNAVPCKDALKGYTFYKGKKFGSNCNQGDLWSGNSGTKEKCAEMCSYYLDCKSFHFRLDGTCKVSTFCTDGHAVSSSDHSLYVRDHNNCPTDKDYRRSMIGDKSTMSQDLKWIFNSNYPNDPFSSQCSEKMGDVYTQFEGYGVGKLTYGGCSKGRVEVYLDGKQIDFAEMDTGTKEVKFEFSPYSKLEIKEADAEAIIEIISLEVGCKGYDVIQEGYDIECKSNEIWVGTGYKSGNSRCFHECRKRAETEGRECRFVAWGYSGEDKHGYCIWEQSDACNQGSWHTQNEYSLYKLERRRCANNKYPATRHRQSCPRGYECMGGDTCLLRPASSVEYSIVEGDDWSNDCPENSFELSEDDCKAAPEKISSLGAMTTIETEVDPVGCFRFGNSLYYNKRDSGNSYGGRRKLCGNFFYEFATDGYCANGYVYPNTIRESVFSCFDTCKRNADIDYFSYDFVDKTCSCYDSESCPRDSRPNDNYKSFKIFKA